jgi:hypothetical protein
MHPGLHAAAEELISAVKRNDAKGVAMAFESAFKSLNSVNTKSMSMKKKKSALRRKNNAAKRRKV